MQLQGQRVNRRAHHLWTSLDMHLLRWSAGGMECPQLHARLPAFPRAMSGSKACHSSAPQHCMCMCNSCWFWRQDEDEDEDSTDKPAQGGAAGVLQNMQQKVAGVGQVRAACWSCTRPMYAMQQEAPKLDDGVGRTPPCCDLSDVSDCVAGRAPEDGSRSWAAAQQGEGEGGCSVLQVQAGSTVGTSQSGALTRRLVALIGALSFSCNIR